MASTFRDDQSDRDHRRTEYDCRTTPKTSAARPIGMPPKDEPSQARE